MINLSSSTPTPTPGYANVTFQDDISGNVSASVVSVGGTSYKIANYSVVAVGRSKFNLA
jgi:hypothetical protein